MKPLRVLVEREESEAVERWLKAHGARNLQQGDGGEHFLWYTFDGPKTPGRKPKIDKERILSLRGENLSYGKIAEAVGCTRGYVQHVVEAARGGNG